MSHPPHILGLVLTAAACGLAAVTAPDRDRPTRETASCVAGGCHAGITGRPVVHAPVAQGLCMDCHQYTSARDHLFRLTTPPQDLCLKCHETDYLSRQHVHGPVAIGACLICHDPHSSSNPMLLTMRRDKLCLDCHAEKMPEGRAARHLHKPMRDGCTGCHDPHASDVRYQLHDDGSTLCLRCHEGVRELLASSAITHGPAGDGDGCAACHNPHFTELPYLQKKPQPQLCLECHDRPVETADGRVLADMAALLADNPNHHGPIRDGDCTACHQPHAGDHFRLLLKAYPPEFYAAFELERYTLCFNCHLPDMVLDESGTGLTGFRDGDRNLHWLHVNQAKGRTCRACHEVHASKRPFHIRESVPFGSSGWLLDINFTQIDGGGQCAPACHKPKTYRRNGTPSLSVPAAYGTGNRP